ncbi:MAG: RluA family pseudouridine synthase [Wolinella sp.]
MPFVTRIITQREPIKLFLLLMREFGISQNEAQRWIDKGRILHKESKVKNKGEVISGTIEVCYFTPSDTPLEPLFTTPNFAIFDKPSDLLIHPKGVFSHVSLMDSVRALFGSNATLAHRIDKETSGLVLVSKNRTDDLELKRAFMERAIDKQYLALVSGCFLDEAILDFPLLSQNLRTDLGIKSIVAPNGKPSQTEICPLEYDKVSNTTLLLARPLTGRTHQIRVHLAHAGFPIVGDPLYGAREVDSRAYLEHTMSKNERAKYFGATRLMLHANRLGFWFGNRRYEIVSRYDFLRKVQEERRIYKDRFFS